MASLVDRIHHQPVPVLCRSMSGKGMVEWLAAHPKDGRKSMLLSRKPPSKATHGDVERHAIDLLDHSPEELAGN